MINPNKNHFPSFVNKKYMAEKIKIFEKFGIVDLRDPKNSEKLIPLLSERVSEHISRCNQKNVPPTHPLYGSPLDSAEIDYILFHKWAFQNFRMVPDEKEIENNFVKMCNETLNTEMMQFGRAWVDISFFIDEKKEINYQRLFNNNFDLQNEDFYEYLELPEKNEENKVKKMKLNEKNDARYERSCYHKLLSGEKNGTLVFRPSSYNRKKNNNIFEYYVITIKTGENSFCDQLLVFEKGRGWCITGAKYNKESGDIYLSPNRFYLPTFFDILIKILSKLTLNFSNIKRYNSEQIELIYKETVSLSK